MSEHAKNKAKSIRQLLKNKGQELDVPFQEMLQRYAIERFLFRLGDSVHRDLFVLKGAQMLIVWQSERLRPTLDIDLLGFTENSLDNLKLRIQDLCEHNQAEEDGLVFLPASIKTVRIKEDADYAGVRITFEGRLENARVPMQIDVGFNDAVTPQPCNIVYPSILGMTKPGLRGYNRETTIAEKFEAMVKLGELNSRMKDFFDIWLLSRHFEFEQKSLSESFQATFARRGTELTGIPSILHPSFDRLDDKRKQWNAFRRKSRADFAPEEFTEITAQVREFIEPIVMGILSGDAANSTWSSPGLWQDLE